MDVTQEHNDAPNDGLTCIWWVCDPPSWDSNDDIIEIEPILTEDTLQ